jgi:hypothetical protein
VQDFRQDLDHFEREEILHGILLKTPSKFAIFFLGFEQDSVQDSVQDFLQDSFPPPPPLNTPTMAGRGGGGGGDIVANTCTDAASSGSN